MSESYLLGFDIGGTKCAVILGKSQESQVQILDRIAFSTDSHEGYRGILSALIQTSKATLNKHGLSPMDISALGISCGGPLNSEKGMILNPPNLPGWNHAPIVEDAECLLGISGRLQNDANACALAEWKWGAGRGCRNLIFLTFGTGMGAGLILDGKLYSGTNDMAGEVGHIRLAETGPEGYRKRGSFEGFCSGGGIANFAKMLITNEQNETALSQIPPEELTAQRVFEEARNGDPTAREIIKTVAHRLGQGLAILVDILNPEMIIIGSIYVRAQDMLESLTLETLKEEALPENYKVCRIVPSQLGESLGDYASLSVAQSLVEEMRS